MALVSDKDYFLHQLRLEYLRRVEDPLGPSLISFPPTLSHHAAIAGFSDPATWPELHLCQSPRQSLRLAHEHDQPQPNERVSSMPHKRNQPPPVVTIHSPFASPIKPDMAEQRMSSLPNHAPLPPVPASPLSVLTGDSGSAYPAVPEIELDHREQDQFPDNDTDEIGGDDGEDEDVDNVNETIRQDTAKRRATISSIWHGSEEDVHFANAQSTEEGDEYVSDDDEYGINMPVEQTSPSSISISSIAHTPSSSLPGKSSSAVESNSIIMEPPPKLVLTKARERRRVNINRNFSRNVSLMRSPQDILDDTSPSIFRKTRQAQLNASPSMLPSNGLPPRPRSAPPQMNSSFPSLRRSSSSTSTYQQEQQQEQEQEKQLLLPRPNLHRSSSTASHQKAKNDNRRYSAFPISMVPTHEPTSTPDFASTDVAAAAAAASTTTGTEKDGGISASGNKQEDTKATSKPPLDAFAASLSKRPPPVQPNTSTLTTLLSGGKTHGPNPLTSDYQIVAADSSDGIKLIIYFPHSNEALTPLKFNVKKDTTVEETIGYALLRYWDSNREPKLASDDERKDWDGQSLIGDTDPVKWNLMIADDGEVDDDFPALDRANLVGKVGANEFGLVRASPSEITENEASDSRIQRRPAHQMGGPSSSAQPGRPTLAPLDIGAANSKTGAAYSPSVIGATPLRTGAFGNSSSINALPVYLRVRIPLTGVEAVTTTLNVPSDMYLADVLELICRKKELGNPKEWALLIADQDMIVPLDRTVESLQGMHSLRLARKQDVVGLMRNNRSKPLLQNTNPSASIFKRISEPQGPRYVSASDLTSTYKKFVVHRKLPMQLSRHERVLVIDGQYIHIMSDKSKSQGSGRTASFHASHILECKQSRRTPNAFKLIVRRGRDAKRYDFEVDSSRESATIVAYIRRSVAAYRAELERQRYVR